MYSKKQRDRISNFFNNQEGQNYPCSNQIVCCGYATDDNEKWNNFIKENKNKDNIERLMKREIILKNKERWIRVPISESVRGYRYYKIKVDKNIDEKFLEQIILPCCAHYCCSFEWI